MAKQTLKVLGKSVITILADKGYYSRQDIKVTQSNADAMHQRKQTVEHPIGTIKF